MMKIHYYYDYRYSLTDYLEDKKREADQEALTDLQKLAGKWAKLRMLRQRALTIR